MNLENDLSQTGWIKTYTGKMIRPLAMTAGDLDILDIAHALSRVCRFAGHCRGFLSVAWHSLRVYGRVIDMGYPVEDKENHPLLRAALLHDASEAYLGDVPRPLKNHPSFAFYRKVEFQVETIVALKFQACLNLEGGSVWPTIVKQADDKQLAEELSMTRYLPVTALPDQYELEFLEAWENIKP